MNNPLLSFCIPTYNRGLLLKETIESIINQTSSSNIALIEICISDNASTDETKAIINEIKNNTPIKIVYHINKENLGADRNYLKVIEIASGDFCWFMGSDDTVRPGALNRVIEELKKNYDLLILNRNECDFKLNFIEKRYWLTPDVSDLTIDTSSKEELYFYLEKCTSLGGLFSYLSSIVFLKKRWQNVSFDESFIGTAYSHVYILLTILMEGAHLKYLSDGLVNSRGENDSFGTKSLAKRVLLDINAYLTLNNSIVTDDSAKQKVIRVLKKELDYVYFDSLFSCIRVCSRSTKEDWDLLLNKLNLIHYYNKNIPIASNLFNNIIAKKLVYLLMKVKKKRI